MSIMILFIEKLFPGILIDQEMIVKMILLLKKRSVFLKIFAPTLILWIYFYCSSLEWWAILHNRCETPENEMKAMQSLTKETHLILEHFNLTHFPMGGRYLSFHNSSLLHFLHC